MPPVRIPNPRVGPPALRRAFHQPTPARPADPVPAPPQPQYTPLRIPNRYVGPPVLRQRFRYPSRPRPADPPPPTPTPGAAGPVRIPSAYVGPPALRRRFRYPRRPRAFDTYGAGNALATQCQNIWTNTQYAQQTEINIRHTKPLVRIWDGNWYLQFVLSTDYQSTFAWILNDSGPGRSEIP